MRDLQKIRESQIARLVVVWATVMHTQTGQFNQQLLAAPNWAGSLRSTLLCHISNLLYPDMEGRKRVKFFLSVGHIPVWSIQE